MQLQVSPAHTSGYYHRKVQQNLTDKLEISKLDDVASDFKQKSSCRKKLDLRATKDSP